MTSAINTNGINVNYPVPGINNSSQGFRDNFSAIKTDFNTAATEITDLQNKVLLKSALDGSTLNNDMAGAPISNALTRSFRASTYNLGNAISGIVTVNATLGDVQYGTIAGDTIIQFTGWSPTRTQSNVELQLAVSNSSATISFPSSVANSNTLSTIENFVSGTANVTIPYGVTQLDYRFSTIDCGNTVIIEPYNRSRQTAQVQQRSPAPTGFQGDVAGDVAVDANYVYVCTGTFDSGGANTISKTVTATTDSTDEVVLNNTNSLVTNAPIIFDGTTFGGIVANTVYYIKTIVSGNNAVTLSSTRSDGTAGSTFNVSTASGTCTATSYNGTSIWKRTALTSW
jgi:hypothetical protein